MTRHPLKRFIGIDPGLSGGVAILDQVGQCWAVHDMPIVNGKVDCKALRGMVQWDGAHIAVEKVELRSGQCGVQTMLSNYGRILAVLELIENDYHLIASKDWQKGMGLPKARKEKIARYTMMAADRWTDWPFYGPGGGLKDGRAAACWIADKLRIKVQGLA